LEIQKWLCQLDHCNLESHSLSKDKAKRISRKLKQLRKNTRRWRKILKKPDRNILDANKFTLGALYRLSRALTKLEGFFRDMWLSKKIEGSV
jgi:citrate lyase synthetase